MQSVVSQWPDLCSSHQDLDRSKYVTCRVSGLNVVYFASFSPATTSITFLPAAAARLWQSEYRLTLKEQATAILSWESFRCRIPSDYSLSFFKENIARAPASLCENNHISAKLRNGSRPWNCVCREFRISLSTSSSQTAIQCVASLFVLCLPRRSSVLGAVSGEVETNSPNGLRPRNLATGRLAGMTIGLPAILSGSPSNVYKCINIYTCVRLGEGGVFESDQFIQLSFVKQSGKSKTNLCFWEII